MIVATVGHNPLPVWLGITARRMQLGSEYPVRLIHTLESEIAANRLAKSLGHCECAPVNPADPQEIGRQIPKHCAEIHITAGPRFVALAACRASRRLGNVTLCYLDDARGGLIVGQSFIPLSDNTLGLDCAKVAELHGYRPVSAGVIPLWSDEQVSSLIHAAAGGPDRILRIEGCSRLLEYAILQALRLAQTGRYSVLGPQQWRGWDDNLFEVDVHAFDGWRFTAISCTLSADGNAKAKVYEVVHRSRQLGGSAARAVAISMLEEAEIEELAAEIRDQFDIRGDGLLILGRKFFETHTSIQRWAERLHGFLALGGGATVPGIESTLPVIDSDKQQILAPVGTNPLPVLNSIRREIARSDVWASDFQVWLFATPESADRANTVAAFLRDLIPSLGGVQAVPVDGGSLASVGRALTPWLPCRNVTLHLSGGKRILSAWMSQALPDASFCVVSQTGHRLLWSHGAQESGDLRRDPELTLTLDRLFALHGESTRTLGQPKDPHSYAVQGVECRLFEPPAGSPESWIVCYVLGFQLFMMLRLAENSGKILKWSAMKQLSRARRCAGNSAHVLCFVHRNDRKLQREIDDSLGADQFAESLWVQRVPTRLPETRDYYFKKLGWSQT